MRVSALMSKYSGHRNGLRSEWAIDVPSLVSRHYQQDDSYEHEAGRDNKIAT
jgi:hypothetical protein